MTSEEANVAILRRMFDEWNDSKGAGSQALDDVFHADIRFTSLAGGAPGVDFTVSRNGKEDFLSYIDGLTRDWAMCFYRVDEFIAQGDRVVAIGATRWLNKKTNKPVETRKVDVFRMRDGQIVEFDEYYDTAQLIAAAQP